MSEREPLIATGDVSGKVVVHPSEPTDIVFMTHLNRPVVKVAMGYTENQAPMLATVSRHDSKDLGELTVWDMSSGQAVAGPMLVYSPLTVDRYGASPTGFVEHPDGLMLATGHLNPKNYQFHMNLLNVSGDLPDQELSIPQQYGNAVAMASDIQSDTLAVTTDNHDILIWRSSEAATDGHAIRGFIDVRTATNDPCKLASMAIGKAGIFVGDEASALHVIERNKSKNYCRSRSLLASGDATMFRDVATGYDANGKEIFATIRGSGTTVRESILSVIYPEAINIEDTIIEQRTPKNPIWENKIFSRTVGIMSAPGNVARVLVGCSDGLIRAWDIPEVPETKRKLPSQIFNTRSSSLITSLATLY